MVASLNSLYHSKSFDELEAVSLLEPEIPEQNIAKIPEQAETCPSFRRPSIDG